NQIKGLSFQCFQSFQAIGGHVNLETEFFQSANCHLLIHDVVACHKDASSRHLSRSMCSHRPDGKSTRKSCRHAGKGLHEGIVEMVSAYRFRHEAGQIVVSDMHGGEASRW